MALKNIAQYNQARGKTKDDFSKAAKSNDKMVLTPGKLTKIQNKKFFENVNLCLK